MYQGSYYVPFVLVFLPSMALGHELPAAPVENPDLSSYDFRQCDFIPEYSCPTRSREALIQKEEESPASRALDRLVDRTRLNIRRMYIGLVGDDERDEGEGINLPGLFAHNPAIYNLMLLSSLQREKQLTAALEIRPAKGAFALLYGENRQRSGSTPETHYNMASYGLLLGADLPLSAIEGLSVGWHAVIGRQTVKIRATPTDKGDANSVSAGLQMRYMPDSRRGGWVSSSLRVGREAAQATREEEVLYRAEWKGYSKALTLAGGYRWALTEHSSLGPVVGMQYTRLTRNAIKEQGEAGAFIMGQRGVTSLRGQVGAEWQAQWALTDKQSLHTWLQLLQEREFKAKNLHEQARFSFSTRQTFSSEVQNEGQRAFTLKTGGRYQLNENWSVGAEVGRQWDKSHQTNLSGAISVSASF